MSDGDYRVGRGASAFYRVLQALVYVFSVVWFRIETHGQQSVPTGGVLIAPVHRSNLDVPLTGTVTRRRLRYMAKDSLFIKPFWQWFITALGGFPVRRGSLDRDALRASLQVLGDGDALVVFPEGERKAGPRVLPMFDGVMYLAAKAGVPVVPIGIGGTERAMPKGAKLPRPRKVVFVYGTPIDPPRNDGKRVGRSALTAASDDLRESIQAVFDEAQRLAGTPNDPNG